MCGFMDVLAQSFRIDTLINKSMRN